MRVSFLRSSGGRSVFVALTAFALLASCSEDPAQQEKLVRMQAEMQEESRQLRETQSALEKAQAELKAVSGSAKSVAADKEAASHGLTLTKEQLEESYILAGKEMKSKVEGDLKNLSVENFTSFPVVMPSDVYPYSSKIALTVRSDKGQSYHLEFPVFADATGKWNFPSLSDLTSALANDRTRDQKSNDSPGSAPLVYSENSPAPTPTARPISLTTGQGFNGPPATETRVIDWGNKSSVGSGARSQAPLPTSQTAPVQAWQPPLPTPQAQAPALQPTPRPQAVNPMASDKDVTIHW